jgi:hypothetical protein
MASAGDAMSGQWGTAPSVLVFSDSEEGLAEASECALRNGGRLAAALPVEQALDRLENQVLLDLLIVDVREDHGPLLDRLFRKVEEGSEAALFESIVIVSPQLVDVAAAQVGHPDVNLMVGRDPEGLSAAVATALVRSPPRLREPGADEGALRLRDLIDDMERVASSISSSVAGSGTVPARGDAADDDAPPAIGDLKPADAMAVRDIIRARRLREQFFGPGLFADPAWDILLDLTAARIEGRSVAVSSLCIAAAVPPTTALRWIKHLTAAGLLRRVADPDDGRRIFIELTDMAARRMMAYFSSLLRLGRG